MNNPSQQRVEPPNYAPPPSSNRKLWIIGIVLGLILVCMGGCVACASFLAISAFNENRQDSAPTRRSGVSERGNTPQNKEGVDQAATELAGGSWSGALNCEDGDTLPVVIKVSGDGMPVYSYRTRSGDREEAIRSVGQTFRFVPPEGGVFNAVVDSLSVSGDRFSYSTATSSERAGGGSITQGGGRTSVSAVLSGNELEVEVGMSSSASASQPGIIIRGDESTSICRGKIPKQ
jgi:hypothetical protein